MKSDGNMVRVVRPFQAALAHLAERHTCNMQAARSSRAGGSDAR